MNPQPEKSIGDANPALLRGHLKRKGMLLCLNISFSNLSTLNDYMKQSPKNGLYLQKMGCTQSTIRAK